VSNTLVPAGAVFNDIDTHPFDESSIVRHGQAYGMPHAKTTTTPHKVGAAVKKPAKKSAPSVSFGPSN
jgi:hypothetical protein